MEHLPLLISGASLLLWSLSALFWPWPLRASSNGMGFGFSLIQLGSAVWGAVRTFGEGTGVRWKGTWFSLNAVDTYEISLIVDHASCVMWLVVSLIATVLAYFALLSQLRGGRAIFRGE